MTSATTTTTAKSVKEQKKKKRLLRKRIGRKENGPGNEIYFMALVKNKFTKVNEKLITKMQVKRLENKEK